MAEDAELPPRRRQAVQVIKRSGEHLLSLIDGTLNLPQPPRVAIVSANAFEKGQEHEGDIGDILGASPATVKKHVERIFAKLGVETRTSAAAMALNRLRQLHPQWEL